MEVEKKAVLLCLPSVNLEEEIELQVDELLFFLSNYSLSWWPSDFAQTQVFYSKIPGYSDMLIKIINPIFAHVSFELSVLSLFLFQHRIQVPFCTGIYYCGNIVSNEYEFMFCKYVFAQQQF